MAGHDRAQSSTSSKKRKHTEEERAERKKAKKQKHLEVEDSTEVLAGPENTETSKRKEKRKQAPDDEVFAPVAIQQDAQVDLELSDMEDAVAPVAEGLPAVSKRKKKRRSIAEGQPPSPKLATTEQEDIELPDADDETFTSSPPFMKSSIPAAQPTPPSDVTENSPFHTARASLYVPCPAISLSTALPSLISTHLTPLLLTYYPPLDGIILSISDVNISSKASTEPGKPLELPTSSPNSPQLALCADEGGVSFTWLSFTATTFRPGPSSTLSGYINVASEGFIGLVLYNYFQVGIAKNRIPPGWKWSAPGSSRASKKQPKKGRIRDAESEESSQVEPQSGSTAAIPDSQATATQDTDGRRDTALHLQNTGYWTKADGAILKDTDLLSFRVVDCDIVPSSARNSDRLALQIEGTLLDEEDEERILAEERAKFERAQNKAHARANSLGSRHQANVMSGGLGMPSREGSAAAAVQRHRVAY